MPRTTVPARMRPIPDVAYATRRPERTIRTWAAASRIDSMKDPRTGALLVDLVAAAHLSQQAGRRNRAKAAA